MQSKSAGRRRAHNQELIRKMRAGENLESYEMEASWYPPRPIIEKDKSAIRLITKKANKVSNN